MLTDLVALEIWLIYEYWNLIGQKHFHPRKIKNLNTIISVCLKSGRFTTSYLKYLIRNLIDEEHF